MKNSLLILLLLGVCLCGNGQIWTQDFETNGLGTQYTSVSVFTNNPNAHYNRTNGVGISTTTAPYSAMHGSFYWAGENQNDQSVGGDGLSLKTITFTAINVAGQTNLQFRGLVASGNTLAGYDFNDSFYFEYRMDAGPWTKFLQFAAPSMGGNIGLRQDVNLDGIGEGTALTPEFAQFTSSLPVTGNSLQIRITTINDGLGEEIAFDYLRLYSLTTPVLGCTNPLASNFNVAANTDNGSCSILGCVDNTALNYTPQANASNGTCIYTVPNLIINEVHYNPSLYAGFADNTHEFIEIHNRQSTPVNLVGFRLAGAVDYTFVAGSTIAAGGYVVVAANAATYAGVGVPVYQFIGSLSNSGDVVRLVNPQNILIDAVGYYPNVPWPTTANGNGGSLQLTNPLLNNDLFSSWCADPPTAGVQNACYALITGCTDPLAQNYNASAQTNDNSCVYAGCTYPNASNYSASASIDDGSCSFGSNTVYGCTYSAATNFNAAANFDDGSCLFAAPLPGCTNPAAINYNANAQIDNGSCQYATLIPGCTYPNAINYNPTAQVDNGSCLYASPIPGCTNAAALNYNANAQIDNGTCVYPVPVQGCTYPDASNFNPNATLDDGSCLFVVSVSFGCTYSNALNFDPNANRDDGSCNFPVPIPGCTNATALNYNPLAQVDDNSCVYLVPTSGCTYPGALNYSMSAQADDGSCVFPNINACLGDLNNDQLVGVSDLILFINVFGSTCN